MPSRAWRSYGGVSRPASTSPRRPAPPTSGTPGATRNDAPYHRADLSQGAERGWLLPPRGRGGVAAPPRRGARRLDAEAHRQTGVVPARLPRGHHLAVARLAAPGPV